jgi:hypothetical protein
MHDSLSIGVHFTKAIQAHCIATMQNYDLFYWLKQVLHKEWAYESTNYSKFTNKILRVEIPKLIIVISILITKGLLVIITYHFLPKDEINRIN